MNPQRCKKKIMSLHGDTGLLVIKCKHMRSAKKVQVWNSNLKNLLDEIAESLAHLSPEEREKILAVMRSAENEERGSISAASDIRPERPAIVPPGRVFIGMVHWKVQLVNYSEI